MGSSSSQYNIALDEILPFALPVLALLWLVLLAEHGRSSTTSAVAERTP